MHVEVQSSITQVYPQTIYGTTIGGCVPGVHVIFDGFNTGKINWTNELNVIFQYHLYNKNKRSIIVPCPCLMHNTVQMTLKESLMY